MTKKSVLSLIKRHCKVCCGGGPRIIEQCNDKETCALHPIRGGIDRQPNRIRSEISKRILLSRKDESRKS